MKVFYYHFSAYGCDSDWGIDLTHTKFFSIDEFRALCKDIMLEEAKKQLEETKDYEHGPCYFQYSLRHEFIAKRLEELGFKSFGLNYTATAVHDETDDGEDIKRQLNIKERN